MDHGITKFFLLVVTALSLSGCLTEKVRDQKKADALQSTLSAYSGALRWGYFDQAYSFHKFDKGEYPIPPDRLKELRITSIEVIHPPTLVADDTAVQLVEINYYYADAQKLKSVKDRQVWAYDPTEKRWYLKSRIPDFK